jgi:hypothetical protein
MGLYESLLGRDDNLNHEPRVIPPRLFLAALAEFARGALTAQQAKDAVRPFAYSDRTFFPRQLVGSPVVAGLTNEEALEAQTLLDTVTGTGVQKLARAKEIEDVLVMAEYFVAGYRTPSQVKTRLGV